MTGLRRRLVTAVVGIATILVLVAIGIVPFFTPQWIYPEQDRAAAEAWTGWSPATDHEVTGSVLHDLIVGPPTFAQAVDGQPVFDPGEASHLRDVRHVVLAFAAVAVGSAAVLVVSFIAIRPRIAFWRAVAGGTKVMAVGVVALGIFALVAFDAVFELFHRLFFAPGTYSFDPRTERLVQLFPDSFWSQTSIVLGAWLLVLAVIVWSLATVRVRRLEAASVRGAAGDRADAGGPEPATVPGPAGSDNATGDPATGDGATAP